MSAGYRAFLRGFAEDRITRSDIDLYIAVLLRSISLARQIYGVETVVMFVRMDEPPLARTAGLTESDVVERLARGGARVIDATLLTPEGRPSAGFEAASQLEIPGDRHPTALAHRLRARLLYGALKSQHLAFAEQDLAADR